MSKLKTLIAEARASQPIHERISAANWALIAQQCGQAEIAEIQERIAHLKVELTSVEVWDGDTQDDINLAIYAFTQLLKSASSHG
ncbi:hypothetical protein HX866_26970 [Pseudomonas gingeri]|uniref:hypothetical protein n=1 Tax=Pseudomonas gingeri TaxID=117681 RepID=UPI0015A0F20B|nr:hypothetical protein [Pseudomonas gingeri]NWA28537.1 hypothetical protein [Pseudomonas gingeri]